MTNPTITLQDLIYGSWPKELAAVDRALMIDEEIQQTETLYRELEELRGEVADSRAQEEEIVKLRGVLDRLVRAIDETQLGRLSNEGTARVGALVIIEPSARTLAPLLGDVLEEARKAI